MELYPEELQLSGDEENLDASRTDSDKGLKIRRTVTQVKKSASFLFSTQYLNSLLASLKTKIEDPYINFPFPLPQVVPSDSQENGQTNEEEEEEEDKKEKEKEHKASKDQRKSSLSEEASDTQISVNLDGETKKGKFLYKELVLSFTSLPP